MATTSRHFQNGNVYDDDDEVACSSFAMTLMTSAVTPIVLQAALELDVLEIIKKLGPNGGHFSAKEIVAHLPAKNPEAATMLDRMLCLLASHSVLTCTIRTLPDGRVERLYGLASVCKFLTKDDKGATLAPLASISKPIIDSCYQLKDSILEGGHPFERAYGVSHYVYNGQNPDMNEKFNNAMAAHSTITMDKILTTYDGFEGLTSLVDVGGGNGATLKKILTKYPKIRGVNLDLPHVINDASPCPGVEHVVGDMFESIPKGDAVFIKWICHAWSDEQCIKFLKNCYDAIPDHGKVIVCESFLPEEVETSHAAKFAFQFDAIMMVVPNGKERTEKEFQALAKAAGFQGFRVACSAYDTKVMEFLKQTC